MLLEMHGDLNIEVEVTLWTFSGCHGPPRPPVSPSSKLKEAGSWHGTMAWHHSQGGAPVTKTTGPTSDRLPSHMVASHERLRVARGNGWPFQAVGWWTP